MLDDPTKASTNLFEYLIVALNSRPASPIREIHFLKGYTVFNCDQIEGLPEQYYVRPEPKFSAVERIEHAEAFFASTRADIRYRGGKAYCYQQRSNPSMRR